MVDLEAAEPEVDESQPLSFGGVEIEDDSTFERWLQSALKATVAPKLVVDGRLGPATERAILAFQQRAQALAGRRLAADGVLGKQTIAALEVATDSEAPSREAKPAAEATGATKAWATSSFPPLKVSEVAGKDGATEYVISDGEQEVRFSYWTPGYRDYKPERSTTPPGIPPNPQIGCNPTKSGVLEGGGVFTGQAERRRGRSRQAKTRQNRAALG
ncbi:MAG: peptidoglycan-binding protein [Nannocystis sp.]|nr:peptidoglycan-binding protein [Nannocystis sp.]